MKSRLTTVTTAIVLLLTVCGAADARADKTLVSWVTITGKNVRAGSVLTVQVGPVFDGIIFAERAPRKWMAGSDFYRRTGNNFKAIVYKGDQISICRHRTLYGSHKAGNIDLS